MAINMKHAIVLIALIFTCACTFGPNYHRPNIDLPSTYRGAPPREATQPQQDVPQQASQPSGPSFGDQKWFEVFQDPQLQNLARAALTRNDDVRIAANRILEAQAQSGITRADQLPAINARAASVNSLFARQKPGTAGYLEVLTNETNAFNAQLGLAQAQLNELLGLVDNYKNLGGGWEL
jgi:multidrug efflux system outer membrane protein